jgi:hypothetical protein
VTLLARPLAAQVPTVFRRKIWAGLGGFDETLPHLADWDLWIRLATVASGAPVSQLLVAYRYHPGNKSFLDDTPLRRDFEVLADRYRAARESAGLTLDRVDFARVLAWGPRHRGQRLAAAHAYLDAAVSERDAGSLLRAGMVLFGERAMSVGAGRAAAPGPLPAWAMPYF